MTPRVLCGLCLSAPHVARRIACLWLRFIVGVVSVVVELLRLCQSFDTCVFKEVGHCHCRDFFHGCRTVGVTLHVGFETDFLEGGVYLSTKKFLRERPVEAISVVAQMRAGGSSVLSALSLDI